MNIETKIEQWLKIRDAVLNEATRPVGETATAPEDIYPTEYSVEHKLNREAFVGKLQEICVKFDPNISPDEVWRQCWQGRYRAGVSGQSGVSTINRIRNAGVFADYRNLVHEDWDVDVEYRQNREATFHPENWGCLALNYLENIHGHKWRLINIVRTARAINEFVANNPEGPILQMLEKGDIYNDRNAFWRAHEHFSYDGTEAVRNTPETVAENLMPVVPAFHIMMDLGLECVKPDRVLTYEMHRLNWLPPGTLPPDTTRDGVAAHYNQSYLYKPLIDAAVEIANAIPPEELVFGGVDVSHNPVRAFDFILVKYGMEPELDCGIARNLDKRWCPVEKFVRL